MLVSRAGVFFSIQAQITVQHMFHEFIAQFIGGANGKGHLYGGASHGRLCKVRNCWAEGGHKFYLSQNPAIRGPIFAKSYKIAKFLKSTGSKQTQIFPVLSPPG
jgi:hypothetical protein